MTETLTRKEISALTGNKLCEVSIGRREKEIGLDKARCKGYKRPVHYRKTEAIDILTRAELL